MEKAFIFMARMRVPGGDPDAGAMARRRQMARERGNGTLRLTTRQTIQFHGIIKSNLRPLIQGAARGDAGHHRRLRRRQPQRHRLGRSVAPRASRDRSRRWPAIIATHLLPHTPRLARDLARRGAQVAGGEEEDEPILGRTYLPRKFKIAIAVPPHNDVDVFAQDLGFIAIEQAWQNRRL